MKKVRLVYLLSFLICVFFMTSDSLLMAKEPDYPMVCKGGGSMVLRYSDYGGFDGKKFNAFVHINFAKAPAAASQKEPGPGECAWLDRPIDINEPAEARYRFKDEHIREIKIELNKIFITDYTSSDLRNIVDAVYNGKVFYFRCKKEGNLLKITKWGP